MKVPRQILVNGKVIQENEVYDFPRWFYAVYSGKNTFDKFSVDSFTLKESIRGVQEEIISAVEALFVRKLSDSGITVNSLKSQLHYFFFVDSFPKEHFANVSSFSGMIKKTQEITRGWESFFSKSEDEIALMEFDIKNVPSVSINEWDNGRPFLDENLLVE